jgi:hypothetical protein
VLEPAQTPKCVPTDCTNAAQVKPLATPSGASDQKDVAYASESQASTTKGKNRSKDLDELGARRYRGSEAYVKPNSRRNPDAAREGDINK